MVEPLADVRQKSRRVVLGLVLHQIVEVLPRIDGVLREETARGHQIGDPVDQLSPDLDELLPIHLQVSVLHLGRGIGQAGHLEELSRQVSIAAFDLVTQAGLVKGDGEAFLGLDEATCLSDIVEISFWLDKLVPS